MVLGSLYALTLLVLEQFVPNVSNIKGLKRDRQAWGGHAWRSSGREYHWMLRWARGGRADRRIPSGNTDLAGVLDKYYYFSPVITLK